MIGAISRENNFDLIRLIAALQVAVHHTLVHLQVPEFQLKLCVGGGKNKYRISISRSNCFFCYKWIPCDGIIR